MIAHQIARQVATPRGAHVTRIHAEAAKNVDETPLTRQLMSILGAAVVCPGGQS